MAHSLTPVPVPVPVPVTATPAHIAKSKKIIPSLTLQRPNEVLEDEKLVHRRSVTLSLAGAVLGLSVADRRNGNANAAARRPPPPPPGEKKDPSLSGLQAKLLASKKRKEAMKQEIAKMREKGKPVDEKAPASE